MTTTDIARFTDRTVVLALGEITHTLAASGAEPFPVTDAGQAQEVLCALFAAAGLDAPAFGSGDARAVLARLAADEDSAAVSGPVLADPPKDDQMGVLESADHIVVLGAVVAWLRLKVDFRYTRKDGSNSVEFKLSQKPASSGYLAQLAQTVRDFFQQP
ncbi:hypothetical protein ACQB60_36025 [Actinomycetota bacterium Odt1-20B]